MLVKCNKCGATYKIDEKKIPQDQKTIIRCSGCKNEIVINEGVKKETQENLIDAECDNCGAYYGIPLTMFKSDTLKVKCGKCNFQFIVSKLNKSLFDDDLKSEVEHQVKIEKIDDRSKENINKVTKIKEAERIDVDNLFDEFSENKKKGTTAIEHELSAADDTVDDDLDIQELNQTNAPASEERQEPTKLEDNSSHYDYLESIKLDNEVDNFKIDIGSVPAEQKYKFFLNPKETKLAQAQSNDQADSGEVLENIDLEKAEKIEELKENKQKIIKKLIFAISGIAILAILFFFHDSIA